MRYLLPPVVIIVAVCGGCRSHPLPPAGLLDGTSPAADSIEANPLFVPVTDREFVWNQVVDEIDNYFKIRREHRVRMVGHVLMEGTIDTFPKVGSTIFEPWRKDSVSGYEQVHATLQSIRRRAHVRVIPSSGGFMIEVAVYKELEDMLQPQYSTVGDATFRYDTTPERTDKEKRKLPPGTLGWISLGRDPGLEQRILSNLRGRLAMPGGAPNAPNPRSIP